jgi:hypothetical protein
MCVIMYFEKHHRCDFGLARYLEQSQNPIFWSIHVMISVGRPSRKEKTLEPEKLIRLI